MTKGVIYLDNAATSWPKPEAVYRAVDIAMREHGANPGRGSHRMSVDAQRIVDETRQEICRLPRWPDLGREDHRHAVMQFGAEFARLGGDNREAGHPLPAGTRSKSPHKGPLRYCRPGVLGANPARRNAAAIASPLVDAADRRRFSDPVAVISAGVVAGRASRA
jgi:hypothetical protein